MSGPTAAAPSRARILDAALALMSEHGVAGTSMRMLAGECGLNVATLYHHFPSKLGLLRAFLDEAYGVTLARIDRRLDGVEGPIERLESVVGTLVWTHLHDDFAQRACSGWHR